MAAVATVAMANALLLKAHEVLAGWMAGAGSQLIAKLDFSKCSVQQPGPD